MNLTRVIPFLFVFLWSTGFIGAKYGLPYIEPFFMLFVRFSLAIIIFYCLIKLFKSKGISIKTISHQVMVGALLHGAYLGGVFFSIKQGTPAGVVAVIVGLQPIATSLISWLWMKKAITKVQVFGLLLGFSGMAIVVLGRGGIGTVGMSYEGFLGCITALVGISLGTLIQSNYSRETPLLTGVMFQYMGGALVMLILTYLLEDQVVVYSGQLIAAMTWLVLALSVLSVLLLMYMIREGEVEKVSSYFYLVPPVAVIESWWLFDERLDILTLLGCAMAVCGVILVVKVNMKFLVRINGNKNIEAI